MSNGCSADIAKELAVQSLQSSGLSLADLAASPPDLTPAIGR
jgi:hypothetical protein